MRRTSQPANPDAVRLLDRDHTRDLTNASCSTEPRRCQVWPLFRRFCDESLPQTPLQAFRRFAPLRS